MNEHHDLLLAVAASVARQAVEAAEQMDLKAAITVEVAHAGDATWDIEATYYRPKGLVGVSGTLRRDSGGMPDLVRSMLGQELDDDGDFTFAVPVAWLPRVEAPR